VLTRFCHNLSNGAVFINVYGLRGGRNVEGGEAVDDETPQSRAEHFRGVADNLRNLAAQMRYDIRRRDQLLALAAGFERFASRLEQEADAETE
jgi:hypothetical protein